VIQWFPLALYPWELKRERDYGNPSPLTLSREKDRCTIQTPCAGEGVDGSAFKNLCGV